MSASTAEGRLRAVGAAGWGETKEDHRSTPPTAASARYLHLTWVILTGEIMGERIKRPTTNRCTATSKQVKEHVYQISQPNGAVLKKKKKKKLLNQFVPEQLQAKSANKFILLAEFLRS